MCTWKKYSFFNVNFTWLCCGIAHKVLDNMDWVFWLYIMNTAFLLLDMALYWRYKNNKAPVTDEKNEVDINEEVEID